MNKIRQYSDTIVGMVLWLYSGDYRTDEKITKRDYQSVLILFSVIGIFYLMLRMSL